MDEGVDSGQWPGRRRKWDRDRWQSEAGKAERVLEDGSLTVAKPRGKVADFAKKVFLWVGVSGWVYAE